MEYVPLSETLKARLIEEVRKPVRKLVIRHLPAASQETVDDLTAKTLQKVSARLDVVRIDTLQNYALRSATNTVRDWIRHCNRNPEPLVSLNFEMESGEALHEVGYGDNTWNPEAMMMKAAIDPSLIDLLRALPESAREIILLTFMHGGPKDVAAATGIPPGTARSRLNRARKAVRLRMERRNQSRFSLVNS